MNLQKLPKAERPRERLLKLGSDALSTAELLAILLGSGTKNRSVLELAKELISSFQSLEALSQASTAELKQIKGIGVAKALQLQAIFALGRRCATKPNLAQLKTPEEIYQYIRPELEEKPVEMLMIVLFDIKQRPIHQELVSKGTMTELLVHPREIFHLGIKHRAHSIVIAHNHPSGDPTPSHPDIHMTQVLAKTGHMIGIPLTDHLIIGKNSFISFRNKGLIH